MILDGAAVRRDVHAEIGLRSVQAKPRGRHLAIEGAHKLWARKARLVHRHFWKLGLWLAVDVHEASDARQTSERPRVDASAHVKRAASRHREMRARAQKMTRVIWRWGEKKWTI